jgi:thiol-disulfide isomerase/thioredoxin
MSSAPIHTLVAGSVALAMFCQAQGAPIRPMGVHVIQPAAANVITRGGVVRDDTQQGPALLPPGTVAPDFTVQDRNGSRVHLSDYKGKVVVVDFWATWCGPCQQSLPSTNDAARKFAKHNVVFLGVNTSDTNDAFHSWLPLHKNLESIKFVIDSADPSKNIASTLYNVSGIPAQYVIGRDGKVVTSILGISGDDSDLIGGIKAALGLPQPVPAPIVTD